MAPHRLPPALLLLLAGAVVLASTMTPARPALAAPGCEWVFNEPLWGSTSYDGDSISTGTYDIDVSTFSGAPANTSSYLAYVVRHVSAWGSSPGGAFAAVINASGGSHSAAIWAVGNVFQEEVGEVKTDANGDFDYGVFGTGTSQTYLLIVAGCVAAYTATPQPTATANATVPALQTLVASNFDALNGKIIEVSGTQSAMATLVPATPQPTATVDAAISTSSAAVQTLNAQVATLNALAGASPTPSQTPTITQTPTPTSTPAYQQVIPLISGNQMLLQRSWTFGQLFDGLAVLVLGAMVGLRVLAQRVLGGAA